MSNTELKPISEFCKVGRLSSNRQLHEIDDCLEDNMEDY